jgi:hypothetical protein
MMPRFLSDTLDRLTLELTPQGTVAYEYSMPEPGRTERRD